MQVLAVVLAIVVAAGAAPQGYKNQGVAGSQQQEGIRPQQQAGLRPQSGQGFSSGPQQEQYPDGPAQYNFQWEVLDPPSGNDFGHSENRDGPRTQGSYHVLLPDTRVMKVEYFVDETGYHPTVVFEGEAQFPEDNNNGGQYTKPAAAFRPQQAAPRPQSAPRPQQAFKPQGSQQAFIPQQAVNSQFSQAANSQFSQAANNQFSQAANSQFSQQISGSGQPSEY